MIYQYRVNGLINLFQENPQGQERKDMLGFGIVLSKQCQSTQETQNMSEGEEGVEKEEVIWGFLSKKIRS